MSDMTDAELRKLAEAATPGPWLAESYLYAGEDNDRLRIVGPDDDDEFNLAGGVLRPDAEYIAAVSPDRVLGLLDRIAELEAKLAAIAKLCDETDVETEEATQAWLVGNIRAALSTEPKDGK